MISIGDNPRILVIAAHPDDEALGCGATINKLIQIGAEAHALILGTGLAARKETQDSITSDEIDSLRRSSQASAGITGYKTISFEEFPDNRMDSVELLEVVRKISHHAEIIKPNMIFTHHHGDLNIDHRVTFNAVLTAFRPLDSCCVNTMLCFETPSSTEWNFPYYRNMFSPNVFVNVAKSIDNKIAAIKCYESEIRVSPHPRSPDSIKTIAKRWGSVAGFKYAEPFELIISRVI